MSIAANQIDQHVFIECGMDLESEKYPFRRKIFIWPSEIEKFRAHCNNIGVYQTAMRYINPIWFEDHKGKIVINAEDSLKYGDFYLDFDYLIESNSDYEKIKEDVKQAIKYLLIFLSIDVSDINFYFSGNKGIHIVINAETFGLKPHPALNRIYRDVAKDIERFCKNKTLDTRVYDNKRMFRLTNSINKKSGLYKIPITYEELISLSYEEITELAKKPRSIEKKPITHSPKAERVFKKHVENWTEQINKRNEFTGRITALKTNPPCIKEMHEKIFKETIDERNNSGTALASFFLQQGVPRNEAIVRLLKWGEENCQPPLKENDIKTIVNSVYDHQYRYGCESFKRLSGVCNKDRCPLFNKECNIADGETDNEQSQ